MFHPPQLFLKENDMAIRIFRRIVHKVQRDTRSYHGQRDWKRKDRSGKKFMGTYRVKWRGSWEGKIVSGSYYILEPPQELKDSGHWACFSHVGGGWYHIHFTQKPENIDSGILSVEKTLAEAFEVSGRN